MLVELSEKEENYKKSRKNYEYQKLWQTVTRSQRRGLFLMPSVEFVGNL